MQHYNVPLNNSLFLSTIILLVGRVNIKYCYNCLL